ncbi:MAG: hypothetical protein ACRDJ4_04275, partial [Actinomycetota bacterium]
MAEVGPILERTVDCEQACAEVGPSPVTKKSGKGEAVNFQRPGPQGPRHLRRQLPARIAVGRRPLP